MNSSLYLVVFIHFLFYFFQGLADILRYIWFFFNYKMADFKLLLYYKPQTVLINSPPPTVS